MPVRYCMKCHAHVPDKFNYCQRCGWSLKRGEGYDPNRAYTLIDRLRRIIGR